VTSKAPRLPRGLRGVNLLGRVSARAAALVLERLFFTPPRMTVRAAVAPWPRGERFALDVPLEKKPLAAWRFGAGPAVALVHGWGGRAQQLGAFVTP
jgi:hypothetical protein